MATKRVLIVEDEVLLAEDIRRRVTTMGYEVVGATHAGEEAVHLAKILQPDLVLMDVRLSGPMDGLEAGRLIEEAVGSALVYVTATPTERMSHHAPKPFTTATLAAVIAAALQNRLQT